MEKYLKISFSIFALLVFLLGSFYFFKNLPINSFLAQIARLPQREENLEKEIVNLKKEFELLKKSLAQKEREIGENSIKFEELKKQILSLNEEIKNLRKEKEYSKPESEKKKAVKEEIICQVKTNEIKREVIFNEICWMGDEDSPANEWIELKNISKNEINLAGWQILNKNQKIKIVLEEIKLLPGEFLLLKRGDDFTGAIKNSDEALFLFDKDCNLQDMVEATSSWPAGDSKTKRTAERREDFTWQTSQNPGGTPGKENSKGLVVLEKEKKEAEETEPKISLNLPSKIFSQKEFEVLFSVSDLKYDTYDVKISILKISEESEQKRTISEVSLDGEEWQDSYKYLPQVFTGNFFSGKFKLRISQEFSGPAEILVKIRNQNKKIVAEFREKISIYKIEEKQIEEKETPLLSQEKSSSQSEDKDNLKGGIEVFVENLPEKMQRDEILSLRVKIVGIFEPQEFKIGLSAPGDEEYPPSFTSISTPDKWQWSRNYFSIVPQNGKWEDNVYLKLNPQSSRYQNIKESIVVASRLRINNKAQDWRFHGTITISE